MIFICQEIRPQICQEYIWICILRNSIAFLWIEAESITDNQDHTLPIWQFCDLSGLLVSGNRSSLLQWGAENHYWDVHVWPIRSVLDLRGIYILKHGFHWSLWKSLTHNAVIQSFQLVLEYKVIIFHKLRFTGKCSAQLMAGYSGP